MPMYDELKKAIDVVMESSTEQQETVRRFKKLINNSIDSDFRNEDIIEVLELITVSNKEEK